MRGKTIIVEAERGVVVGERVVEGDFREVVKDVVREAVEKWDAHSSDLVAIRHQREVEKELPLKPSELDAILSFNPVRSNGRVVFMLPMYVVSYSNRVEGDVVVDEKVYVVAPHIEGFEHVVRGVAIEATSNE